MPICLADKRNEWMNDAFMERFIVYCCTPKALYNHVGGSLLNHHQCAASTWMMRRQPQDNSTSALTTHQLQVERREIEPIKWWGLLGGHDWQGPVEGIWPGHRGYTPTLYKKCHGIFNDHRESGPRFNVSSERRCFLQYSVPVAILGH